MFSHITPSPLLLDASKARGHETKNNQRDERDNALHNTLTLTSLRPPEAADSLLLFFYFSNLHIRQVCLFVVAVVFFLYPLLSFFLLFLLRVDVSTTYFYTTSSCTSFPCWIFISVSRLSQSQ
eukprot:gene4690-3383_t